MIEILNSREKWGNVYGHIAYSLFIRILCHTYLCLQQEAILLKS